MILVLMHSRIEIVSLRHEMGIRHHSVRPVAVALCLRLPVLSAFLAEGGQPGFHVSGQCLVFAEGFAGYKAIFMPSDSYSV